MDPQYILLVHSCVATSLLYTVAGYFSSSGEEGSGDLKAIIATGFPAFLFSIAWVSAIIAILFSWPVVVSYCLWITAVAIIISVPVLLMGTLARRFTRF